MFLLKERPFKESYLARGEMRREWEGRKEEGSLRVKRRVQEIGNRGKSRKIDRVCKRVRRKERKVMEEKIRKKKHYEALEV